MNQDNINSTIEAQSFWKTHYQQYKLSQLSKAEYARKYDLVKNQFIYQVRKFETSTIKKEPAMKSDFIPIVITSPSLPDKIPQILGTLQLGENKKLFLHTETALKLCLESWR